MSVQSVDGMQDGQNSRIESTGVLATASEKSDAGWQRVKAVAEETGEDVEEARKGWKKARAMAACGYSKDEIRAELNQNLSLQGAILTVVIGGATALAGLNVMSDMWDNMALTEGDTYYNASESLNDGISSFFTQLPTVFVVIGLVLVLGYLFLLRR